MSETEKEELTETEKLKQKLEKLTDQLYRQTDVLEGN